MPSLSSTQITLLTLSLLISGALTARTAGHSPLAPLILPAALGLLTTCFPQLIGFLVALALTVFVTWSGARGSTHLLPVAPTFALYVVATAGLVTLAGLGLPVPAPLLATMAAGFLGLATGTAARTSAFAVPARRWLLAGVVGLNAYALAALLGLTTPELVALTATGLPFFALHRLEGKDVPVSQ